MTRRRIVARDGVGLVVHDEGAGAPLVMLHGWPLDHRCFDPQRPLADRHRLIRPDRRGFGASGGTPDLVAELEDLDDLLDALGLGSVDLFGLSQGARVALRYAVTRPGRVRRLALLGVQVDGLDDAPGDDARLPLETFADLARTQGIDAVRAAWLDHPMMDTGGDAALRERLRAMMAPWRGGDLLGPPPRPFDVDVTAAARALTIPVRVLVAEHETLTRRAHARWLEDAVPGARRQCLPGAGHLANLTHPEVVNAALRAFLA